MTSVAPDRSYGHPPTSPESSVAPDRSSAALRCPVGVRLSSIFPVSVLPLSPLGGTARRVQWGQLTSHPTQNIKDENRLPRVVPGRVTVGPTTCTPTPVQLWSSLPYQAHGTGRLGV